MESLAGHLLIASPHLPDPNFFRSVVLMVQHDEEGALGLVLNRPSKLTVGQLWRQLEQEPCENEDPLRIGGPVEGPLMVLHESSEHGETKVVDGLYFSTQQDNLVAIVQQRQYRYTLLNGYSGWGPGQLESELEAGGWLTAEASALHVFSNQDELWKLVVGQIGEGIIRDGLKIKHTPNDPSMN